MKRRYIVKKAFKNSTLGNLRVGYVIPHNKLKFFTKKEIDDNVFIQDFTKIRLPFNYGLIFLSKEFPHPEGVEEETRECMEKRLLCEMVICPEPDRKIFDYTFDNTLE